MTIIKSPPNIRIISRGRLGDLIYREQENELVCGWEFGGGDSLAVIYLPDILPAWASSNLSNIMHNIADYVLKTQAPHHRAVIDQNDKSITIKRTPLL